MIRSNLQRLCFLIVAVSALGLFPNTRAQAPPPSPTQASPRIIEGVTFEPGASLRLWPVGYNLELPAHRRVFLKAPAKAVSRGPRNLLKGNNDARSAPSDLEVHLYFTNPKLPEWANTCGAGEFVTRKVKPTKRVAHAALKLLFAGPTPEEKSKGMESLSPLGAYYLGVSIKDGTAVVNFRRGAEKHLYVSGPACQQERVLTPIVKTLKRFSTIRSVDFAIKGKIIEEWDA